VQTVVPTNVPAPGSSPETAPFPSARTRRDTLPGMAAGQPLDERQVFLHAINAASEATSTVASAVKQGKASPWTVALLLALLVVAGGMWAAHLFSGDRQIQDRLQALEDAEDDRLEHDQWVVLALQALSENKPLPAYPVRTGRRRDRLTR
jgi:hypothetical protein